MTQAVAEPKLAWWHVLVLAGLNATAFAGLLRLAAWYIPVDLSRSLFLVFAVAAVIFWRHAVRWIMVPLAPLLMLMMLARYLQPRLARVSVSSLTGLAVLLAGGSRPALRDEWCAHLAGESGDDPVTWAKARQALGFAAAAVQLRLADAAEVAWRPADAMLASRTLCNLFVWGPVTIMLVAIDRHSGRFGLVDDIQDPAAMGAFLYGVIRTGRWWRKVEPPEPKARRTGD